MNILTLIEKDCIFQGRMHLDLQYFLSAEVHGPKRGSDIEHSSYLLKSSPSACKRGRSPCWVHRVQMLVSQSVPPFASIFSFVHSVDTLPDMEQIHLVVWGSPCRTLRPDSGMDDFSHFFHSVETNAERVCVRYFSPCLRKWPQHSRQQDSTSRIFSEFTFLKERFF